MKAVDIFVMLQSFLKKGQKIEKVTVYPSDYGLKRMADEARFGPKGLTTSKNEEDLGNENKKIKQKGGFEMSAEERAEILEALNEEESDFEASEGTQLFLTMKLLLNSLNQPFWKFALLLCRHYQCIYVSCLNIRLLKWAKILGMKLVSSLVHSM